MKRNLPAYVYAKRVKGKTYYRFERGGASIQEFARADCTGDEIMSYSGHNTKAMVEKYAGEVRQEAAAKRARKKRDGA